LGTLFVVYDHNLEDPDLTGADRRSPHGFRFVSDQRLIKAQ